MIFYSNTKLPSFAQETLLKAKPHTLHNDSGRHQLMAMSSRQKLNRERMELIDIINRMHI